MPSRGHFAVVVSCWLARSSTSRIWNYSYWTNGTELASRNHLLATKVAGVRFAFDCPHHPSIVNHLKRDPFASRQVDRWVPCLSCNIGEDNWPRDILSLLHGIAREPLPSQEEITTIMAVMGYTLHRKDTQ